MTLIMLIYADQICGNLRNLCHLCAIKELYQVAWPSEY